MSIASIDTGDGAGVTKIDHGCDGTVVSVECVQAEEVSLIEYITISGILRRNTEQGGDNNESTLDGSMALTGTMTVSQGEQESFTDTITLMGSISIQVTGTGGGGGGTKVLEPIFEDVAA